KSQPGAAFLAGDRIVCLLKLLKQFGLVGRGDSRAGIADRNFECAVSNADINADFPRVGEFNRIADEIEQHLGEPTLVTASWRQIGSKFDFQAKLFFSSNPFSGAMNRLRDT